MLAKQQVHAADFVGFPETGSCKPPSVRVHAGLSDRFRAAASLVAAAALECSFDWAAISWLLQQRIQFLPSLAVH
jgi:hypothetical protein